MRGGGGDVALSFMQDHAIQFCWAYFSPAAGNADNGQRTVAGEIIDRTAIPQASALDNDEYQTSTTPPPPRQTTGH